MRGFLIFYWLNTFRKFLRILENQSAYYDIILLILFSTNMANKNKISNQSGIALVASIMLIVFVSIAVLGVTTFIIQRLSQTNAKQIKASCIDLAHAGVQQAIYYFRKFYNDGNPATNGYFTSGPTYIDFNNFFVLGGSAADLLMVNTSNVTLSGGDKDLTNLFIQNATNNKSFLIDRMIVNWDNPQGRKLDKIRINNTVLWDGNTLPPINADLVPNFTLDTVPNISSIKLEFNGKMTNSIWIDAQFIMTDGSIKTVRVYPASQNYNFTVKSMGKTTGLGANNIYRTIQADYNTITGKIINYNEIDSVPPP